MVMTALLTLITMFGALSVFTPQISYTTKLDNWMVTCILFVFSALIETVVNLLLNKIYGPEKNKVSPATNVHVKKVMALDGSRAVNNDTKPSEVPKSQKFYLLTGNIDTIFLIIFLSLFSLFNAVYWSDLLST